MTLIGLNHEDAKEKEGHEKRRKKLKRIAPGIMAKKGFLREIQHHPKNTRFENFVKFASIRVFAIRKRKKVMKRSFRP